MDSVILCAGGIDYAHLPIPTNTSNSMVPVNGRPVISWILDEWKKNEEGHIIIVVREQDDTIQEFLKRVYAERLPIRIVTVAQTKSILHSFAAGMELVTTSACRLILGDTLVRGGLLAADQDFLFIQEVDESSRWCLAVLNDQHLVTEFIDKQPNVPGPRLAVCGFYVFSDAEFLRHSLEQACIESKNQISDLLDLYRNKYVLKGIKTTEWFDFGNVDNFFQSKLKLLQGRFFNTLTVDPVLHTITKVSELDSKLRNELKWYELLPDSLKVLTPRIISKNEFSGKLQLTQEYYGYPTLSELYLYSNIGHETWQSILRNLLKVHERFTSFRGNEKQMDARQIYEVKTRERLAKVEKSEVAGLLQAERVRVNNIELMGFPQVSKQLFDKAEELISTAQSTIIHGDFCFSNILYDVNSHIIRLIDPRGNFGVDGIFGDPRYDVAKLRHSVAGLYDYIISDLFMLKEVDEDYEFEVYSRPQAGMIINIFDGLVADLGYDLDEIKWIEGLLFLSMIPYHTDKPLRQKAMFLTGLMRINELENANNN